MRRHKEGDLADYSRAVADWSKSDQWYETACALFYDMELGASGALLDVGCNQGKLENITRASGYQYIGIDANPAAIRLSNCEWVKWFDGKNIPFPTNMFSAVVCIHTLPHVENDIALMKEISRVLQPDRPLGMLVANKWHDFWMTPRNWFTGYRGDPTIFRLYTQKSLKKLLHAAGFSYVSLKYVGRPAYSWMGESTKQWIQVIARR